MQALIINSNFGIKLKKVLQLSTTILPGDQLLAVNGQSIDALSFEQAVQLIESCSGETIQLRVRATPELRCLFHHILVLITHELSFSELTNMGDLSEADSNALQLQRAHRSARARQVQSAICA